MSVALVYALIILLPVLARLYRFLTNWQTGRQNGHRPVSRDLSILARLLLMAALILAGLIGLSAAIALLVLGPVWLGAVFAILALLCFAWAGLEGRKIIKTTRKAQHRHLLLKTPSQNQD